MFRFGLLFLVIFFVFAVVFLRFITLSFGALAYALRTLWRRGAFSIAVLLVLDLASLFWMGRIIGGWGMFFELVFTAVIGVFSFQRAPFPALLLLFPGALSDLAGAFLMVFYRRKTPQWFQGYLREESVFSAENDNADVVETTDYKVRVEDEEK